MLSCKAPSGLVRSERKIEEERAEGGLSSNMVRAPCCDKMGMKKGPWSQEEDQILVAYIQRHGHANWRALPKQAGLLRCGKSCRLRWMNYLRPDIKRGNFTKQEEEMIIRLHETFGNRWSAIAASLPGRTDNEIKNVWHTHLKKLANPNMSSRESKKRTKCGGTRRNKVSKPITMKLDTDLENAIYDSARFMSLSTAQSTHSDFSSCATDAWTASGEISNNIMGAKEGTSSPEEFPDQIDESFCLDALSMDDYSAASMDFTGLEIPPSPVSEHFNLFISSDSDDMDFWLKVYMGAGDLQELSQINRQSLY